MASCRSYSAGKTRVITTTLGLQLFHSDSPRLEWRRRAREHGWRVDEQCECEHPQPQIIMEGIDGQALYIPPMMCDRCHRVVNLGPFA